MGERAALNPALEVSISFGRFENDSLSWEKWSAFSQNRYLDEVEKCATPGSVAMKKAYFEAHYKKIAAQKADLLGEKQMEKAPFTSDDQNGEDLTINSCGTDSEFNLSNSQSSSEGVEQEINLIDNVGRTNMDNREEGVAVSTECVFSPVEADKIEMEGRASEVEAENVKLDQPKESRKVSSVNKETNAANLEKKPKLPRTKASHNSTPRVSKPASTPSKMTSGSSTKKGNSPSLPKDTSNSSKRIANKSLHLSLSLSPSNPDPASLTTMRKKFIMEKMGDKDIVKRAFKTFQNNLTQPKTSGEGRSSIKQQVPTRRRETKISASMTARTENGRNILVGYQESAIRQYYLKLLTKVDGVDKRSGSAVQATSGLKSDIREEKRKEFLKKSKEQYNAKEAERTLLQTKRKEAKDADIRKLRTNLNFKATPMPGASKSSLDKGSLKADIHRHPSLAIYGADMLYMNYYAVRNA
ncbi:Protein WVD2-like 7 [Quillaja saponaria]|nr:Protein WVD2-like 7 [Quillaja saponaria]